MLSRSEMIAFVEEQLTKIPNDRENAIRLLAWHMGEDDPCEYTDDPMAAELWFQQMIGGE